MRILFITPYVPSLIRVRPFNFIRQLSRRHEVTLIALVQGEADESAVRGIFEYCRRVHTIPLSKVKSLANCCKRLLSRMPLQAAYTEWPSVCNSVRRIADETDFDLVHVEHVRGAHLADGIRDVPRVFDSVDCITRLLKQFLAHQRNPLRRLLLLEELVKMRRYEAGLTAMFDKVLITSRRDKRVLERLVRNGNGHKHMTLAAHPEDPKVAVVRNGVDGDYFRPMDMAPDPKTVTFVGKMSYYANSSAAAHFYHDVFPLIRRSHPDARFRIVGSSPPPSVTKLANDPSVQVTGYVPDVRPYIASSAVVVCPLKIGVGIQNKVLEAMSMARPVVASAPACGGIPEAVSGFHLIRTTSPEQVAEAVVCLMDRPDRGNQLGKNGSALVRARYNWEASGRALEEIYYEAIEARGRSVSLAA